jgi:NADH-quinone oxidoreductase subunit F
MSQENNNNGQRLTSVEELNALRESSRPLLKLRCNGCSSSGAPTPEPSKPYPEGQYDVALCLGTSCISSGAEKVRDAFIAEIEKQQLGDRVKLIETGCNGYCAAGPIMVVYPGGYLYLRVTEYDIPEIVYQHFLNGRPVKRLMYRDQRTGEPVPFYNDLPFFANQELRVLRNKGLIEAESLEEYIARDGYEAFGKAISQMTPETIIQTVLDSGLRGRGGAGFPAGLKWRFCAEAEGEIKYSLCNADEGDPGAFMDRSLIESDPHAVLEGMMICARSIGAKEGYIYCRAEYPLAIRRLEKAIADCHEYGLLGKNILGTDFDFDLHISRGSGAFVCGEETALMRSIEGRRGEPCPRPPFPATKGLWDKPSVLNNVETLGSIPGIIRNGPEWFHEMGTEKSPGTKIFALTGNIENVGLVEVPIGMPLGDLLYDIGGGIPGEKKFKAAQIGGPSGGCIPREHLNVPLDYESLSELGAIMGSGGLIVMDEDSCMVDVARFFLEFVQEESCGKCVPCRVGTKRMLEILERICDGHGEEADIERLLELGEMIKDSSLCGLGQTAPNPVLSTIRHFGHEYIEHIRDKQCRAGVCAALVNAPCSSACPANVDIPGYISLIAERRYAEALRLHRERNPLAAICSRVCFHSCESKCRRTSLDDAVSIRNIKRFMVDQEITVQLPEVRENAKNAGRSIAIIGGGPAGLSCAYFLARLGYRPKIYESEPRPGGMLIQAIPAYRLPREIVAREIRMIEHMGVEIQSGMKLGSDFTLRSLRAEGCDAVFLACGAPSGTNLKIRGGEAEGITDALNFLRTYNLRGSVPVGNKVAVIGGGNSAIDAARTAIRLGAEDVTVVYRRSREVMPAYKEEIEEAQAEGVKLITLIAPVEVVTENNRVTGIRVQPMRLGQFDQSGRRHPEEVGDEYTIEADQILVAIGQTLNPGKILDDVSLDLRGETFIKADPVSGVTSEKWIFSGGDMVAGPSSVVEAVAAGERAAVGIDEYLTGQAHAFWRSEKPVDTQFDPEAEPSSTPREQAPMIPVERRRHNFDEVEQPWTEAVAVRQAQRCLRCDYGRRCGCQDSDQSIADDASSM